MSVLRDILECWNRFRRKWLELLFHRGAFCSRAWFCGAQHGLAPHTHHTGCVSGHLNMSCFPMYKRYSMGCTQTWLLTQFRDQVCSEISSYQKNLSKSSFYGLRGSNWTSTQNSARAPKAHPWVMLLLEGENSRPTVVSKFSCFPSG